MAVNKVLLGNDIAAVWNIANANLSGTIYLYMITPNSKELIPVNIVTTTKLTFAVPADIQKLGDVRFDLKWKEGAYNRRVVVNKTLEFVDNIFGTNQTSTVAQPTQVFGSNLTGTTSKFSPVSAQGKICFLFLRRSEC